MTSRTASTPLGADFNRAFELLLADAGAPRQRAHAIRGAQQREPGDGAQTIDCLLRHRVSDLDAGCVQLVFPRADGGGLPFEPLGLRYIDRERLDWKQLDARQCCEIAQVIVSPQFRRRPGEEVCRAGIAESEGDDSFSRRRFPFIAVTLYHAAIALIVQRGYQWMFMTIEPRIQRHLHRHGIGVRQVGPLFGDDDGLRAVHVISTAELLADIERWSPDLKGLYSIVHTQLLGCSPRVAAIRALDR
jgi:N-acyl amino acid synthase of PEP-CTERM/exosortase system